MKWGRLLALAGMFLASQAFAVNEWTGNPPNHYSGIETIIFQNGAQPSAAYDGCTDIWLDSAATTTNRNGSSLLTGYANNNTLIRFDISAIPDDAVIHYAELRLQMTAEDEGADTQINLQGSRVMRDWDEATATWAARKSPVGDSTWSAAGASDASMTMFLYGEAGGKLVSTRFNNYDTDWGRYQELTQGADSVFSGYATGLNDVDIIGGYTTTYLQIDGLLGEGLDVPKRFRIDVTPLVRGWHAGIWANYGISFMDYVGYHNSTVTFADSENATVEDRPELVVHYLYAVASSGGSGGGTGMAGAGGP
jgi:hypothetical protein